MGTSQSISSANQAAPESSLGEPIPTRLCVVGEIVVLGCVSGVCTVFVGSGVVAGLGGGFVDCVEFVGACVCVGQVQVFAYWWRGVLVHFLCTQCVGG